MRRFLRALGRLGVVIASIFVALAIAEGAASTWFRGAFPYLNIYRSSARYGVELEPSAKVAVRSRAGHVTEIRTNALGFRGAEWAAPGAKPRVMLLGDSQMLGYNVAEEETTAAWLERLSGVEVLDAAVPSWGPIEFALAVEELAPVHRPDVVVFVANLANDWVESNVPNTKRNEAADGWIRRKQTSGAPIASESSPLKNWLLNHSQLVFAVRSLAAMSSAAAINHHGGSDMLAGSTAAEQLLRDLPQLARPRDGYRSRVTPHLARVQKTCVALGCSVIAVFLPLDVQVDAAEWVKYRSTPRDASATLALGDAFLSDAGALGIPAIDLLPVLREASPGAFLSDDVHLSPRGHKAVARAIGSRLQKLIRRDAT